MASEITYKNLSEEVQHTQAAVREGCSLITQYPLNSIDPTGIFCNVLDFPFAAVEEALGDIGKLIYQYVNLVDLKHPAIAKHLTELGDSRLVNQMSDTLRCYEHIKKLHADALLSFLRYSFNQRKIISESLIKHLREPPIAAIRERSERDNIRKYGFVRTDEDKKELLFQDIVLSFQNGPRFWFEQPATFLPFARHSKYFKSAIRDCQKNKEFFASLGLPGLASAFGSRISAIKVNESNNSWMGFKRVTVTTAAMNLGKLHGFEIDSSANKVYLLPNKDNALFLYLLKALIPNESWFRNMRSLFLTGLDMEFVSDECVYDTLRRFASVECPGAAEEDGVARLALAGRGCIDIKYVPRLYSLSSFSNLLPSHIADLIDLLEAFPDYNGKPLFNSFHVLCPGIGLDKAFYYHSDRSGYLFKTDVITPYSSKQDLYYQLDRILIEQKMVRPVLLGLADHDYFFISYLD